MNAFSTILLASRLFCGVLAVCIAMVCNDDNED